MTSELSSAQEPNTPSPDAPSQTGNKRRSFFTDPIPWILLVLALGLDQLTKALVIANLTPGHSWPETGFLRITHAWNTGTAFSLLQGQSSLLTYVSFAAVIALYFMYRSVESPTIWVRMAFGMLLGGAIGNLIDRLRLGHVTDFIDVGPWPIFNIADSSIVVGIAVLFLFFWMNSGEKKAKPTSELASSEDSSNQRDSN